MDYHMYGDFKRDLIVKHNVSKVKLVSKVTSIVLLIFLVIEPLIKIVSKQDIISLNWVPYLVIITGNIVWHIVYRKINNSNIKTHTKKLNTFTNLYVYFLLIAGASITIWNEAIFNNLVMYTLIVLACSAYFVLEKVQFMTPLILSNIILIVGAFFTEGYNEQFITKIIYLGVLTPVAYFVSRMFYASFENGIITQSKLMREINEKRKLMKELKHANRQMKLQSLLDPLTKLYNRRAVNEHMDVLSKRAVNESFSLSSVMLDVDYFKQYNDTYGHLAGDEVLVKVGEVLNEISEHHNVFVARWGGEEFMIILTNATEHKIRSLCEDILTRVENLKIEHKASEISGFLTVSIGAHSVNVKREQDVFQSLEFADNALYHVKTNGRNGFSIRVAQ